MSASTTGPDAGGAPPLVDPEVLAARLDAHDTRVLELRLPEAGGAAGFETGHIPGSAFVDYLGGGWRVSAGGAAGLLPPPERLSALLGAVGLRPHDRAVVVPAGTSSGDFAAAARIYWTLKAAGHGRASLLHGGFAAWRAAGLPVETGPAEPRIAGPYPVAAAGTLRATLPEVERVVADGGATLVDSREPASFVGAEKSPQAARAGRLPDAILVEGASAYDPAANRLRPRAELETLFGPVPDGRAIAYCNTGQAAATDWFVLSEILGRRDVGLYDGSMSQWTADAARPVETGEPASR